MMYIPAVHECFVAHCECYVAHCKCFVAPCKCQVAHCKCFVARCKFLLHIVSILVYCIFQKFPAKPENCQNRYPVRNNKKPMRGKEAVFIFFSYNVYICITKGMLKASISVFDSLLFYQICMYVIYFSWLLLTQSTNIFSNQIMKNRCHGLLKHSTQGF